MPRRISLNARLAQESASSAEIEVVLIEITHPDLGNGPIRLSTDNTERLTTEPLTYGTRSRWRAANPETQPYLWIVASALLPSDGEGVPAAAQIVLENLDSRMAGILRGFTTPATFRMAVVLASSPDEIEMEWSDLLLVSAEITAGEITLQISREEIENEHFPSGRMTFDRFPGLHR